MYHGYSQRSGDSMFSNVGLKYDFEMYDTISRKQFSWKLDA